MCKRTVRPNTYQQMAEFFFLGDSPLPKDKIAILQLPSEGVLIGILGECCILGSTRFLSKVQPLSILLIVLINRIMVQQLYLVLLTLVPKVQNPCTKPMDSITCNSCNHLKGGGGTSLDFINEKTDVWRILYNLQEATELLSDSVSGSTIDILLYYSASKYS